MVLDMPRRLVRVSVALRLEPNLCRKLEEAAHGVYVGELGNGEHDHRHNNTGPDVWRYRQGDGTGGRIDTGGAWCAALRSYSFMVAAARHEPPLRVPFKPSRGAQRVCRNLAASGRWILRPGGSVPPLDELRELVPRGATIAWKGVGWRGHVGSWECVDGEYAVTIEGNRNNRGLSGRRFAVVDYHRRTYRELCKRLLGIATLVG